MKLTFTKLETTKDYLEVSFDNGHSWTTYDKSDILANGITFTEEQCSDLEQLRFKGGIKKLESIDFKYTPYPDVSNVVDSNGVFRFCGDYVIPDSVTSIGRSAFASCFGLTSVTIPNSVTSIGDAAFTNCTRLTSVTIGNSVTSIGKEAFSDCTGLTSVTIGDSVTSIGAMAFTACNGLTSVTIPNSVTSIGNYAFGACKNFTLITYSGTMEQFKAITGYTNGTEICDVVCSDGTIEKSS